MAEMNVGALLEAFLESFPAENTRISYRRDVRLFRDFLSADDLLSATATDGEAFLRALEKKGRAPSSINRSLSALRSFYGFCREVRRTENNPFAFIKTIRVTKHRSGYLTKEEKRQLLAVPDRTKWIGMRDVAIMSIALGTGTKISELIRWNIGDAERLRGLPPVDIELVKKYRELVRANPRFRHFNQDALFVGKLGVRLDSRSVRRQLAVYARRGGINKPVNPFVLRNTFYRGFDCR